ncbi:conserved hypothetical protein [Tenacibaculum litopenaei]|uniref:hypothetical protein n=1 Tax=Tenacibaculum litopenaei TaxID=396016 RepID=UPI003892FB15
MKLFILKTNINNSNDFESIAPNFMEQEGILDWSVDLEDRDKVLRIEAADELEENDIINMVTQQGFLCEDLV